MNFVQNKLLKAIVNNNQNNHRLHYLQDFDRLPNEQQFYLDELLGSRGDRAQQALGVLLWAFITKNYPVAVVSCDDLDKLIKEADTALRWGTFNVRSLRGRTTIWGQLTSILVKYEIAKILKPQSGRSPAVIEIVGEEWLQFIEGVATDEMRLAVINSTCKKGFQSLEEYNSSKATETSILQIPQDLNSSEASKASDTTDTSDSSKGNRAET